MAIAAAFFAETLAELGHEVRRLNTPACFDADLIVTTVSPIWKRFVAAVVAAGAQDRTVYWHHAGGVPAGQGCVLAAPPAIPPQDSWSRHIVLPPSSWAAEAGGKCTGAEILVAGAGPAKGGHIARSVARICPDLSWYVLRGRSSVMDLAHWAGQPRLSLANCMVEPAEFLARARAVLAPTRFEVHPLVLVEAAVRGIPIVCTDMPATRAAAPMATFVPMNAPAEEWAAALRGALERPPAPLRLPPYREVVADALELMLAPRRLAA